MKETNSDMFNMRLDHKLERPVWNKQAQDEGFTSLTAYIKWLFNKRQAELERERRLFEKSLSQPEPKPKKDSKEKSLNGKVQE
jgi:hypothetical protein